MSAVVGSETPQVPQPADGAAKPDRSSRKRGARNKTPRVVRAGRAEEVFWAHLEDREEGRHAIEADHLFDTSYAWAA